MLVDAQMSYMSCFSDGTHISGHWAAVLSRAIKSQQPIIKNSQPAASSRGVDQVQRLADLIGKKQAEEKPEPKFEDFDVYNKLAVVHMSDVDRNTVPPLGLLHFLKNHAKNKPGTIAYVDLHALAMQDWTSISTKRRETKEKQKKLTDDLDEAARQAALAAHAVRGFSKGKNENEETLTFAHWHSGMASYRLALQIIDCQPLTAGLLSNHVCTMMRVLELMMKKPALRYKTAFLAYDIETRQSWASDSGLGDPDFQLKKAVSKIHFERLQTVERSHVQAPGMCISLTRSL